MIKHVLFDMGKVVLDYAPLRVIYQYTKDEAMIKKIALSVFYSTEWMLLDAGFADEEECLPVMLSRLDTDEEKRIAKASLENWPRYNLFPFPGMSAVTHALHEQGFGVYILSNAHLRVRGEIRQLLPNPEDFDGMLFSAEVRYLKPQKKIYETACRRFGVSPRECLFVDDLPANVAGAKAAGMDAILFGGSVEVLTREITERIPSFNPPANPPYPG